MVEGERMAAFDPKAFNPKDVMDRTKYGFLARYFEKLRYRFGPRERAGLYTFLELAHEVGELDEVPELRFVNAGAIV